MSAITKTQIKKIKTLQRRLGLAEEDYRLMLAEIAGVRSCKDLQGRNIDKVIKHLEKRMGVTQASREERGNPSPRLCSRGRGGKQQSSHPGWATERQLRKISELWELVSRVEDKEAALRRFARKRFGICAMEWMTFKQASKVIEGLKAMVHRQTRQR